MALQRHDIVLKTNQTSFPWPVIASQSEDKSHVFNVSVYDTNDRIITFLNPKSVVLQIEKPDRTLAQAIATSTATGDTYSFIPEAQAFTAPGDCICRLQIVGPTTDPYNFVAPPFILRVQATEFNNLASGNYTPQIADLVYKAELAESWAVGGTGQRPGEDTDNAKYYAQQAKNAASSSVDAYGVTTGTGYNLFLAFPGFERKDGARVLISPHTAIGTETQTRLNVESTGSWPIKYATGELFNAVKDGGTYAGSWIELIFSDNLAAWVLQTPSITSFNGRIGDVMPQAGDYNAEQVGADPKGTAFDLRKTVLAAVGVSRGTGTALIVTNTFGAYTPFEGARVRVKLNADLTAGQVITLEINIGDSYPLILPDGTGLMINAQGNPYPAGTWIDAIFNGTAYIVQTAGVSSFNGRTGKTVPQPGDYTAADVGAVPTSRTVNGKALSGNIALTASDVSAVPTTRTVNGKALSSNVTITAPDVGAAPTVHAHAPADITGGVVTSVNGQKGDVTVAAPSDIGVSTFNGRKGDVLSQATDYPPSLIGAVPTNRTVNGKALSGNVSLTAADVSAVPTTRTVNGKALSANISLTAPDVGAAATSHTHAPADITGGVVTSVNGKKGDVVIEISGDVGVSSFNGRDGAVVSQPGDYTAAQVGAVPTNRTVNGKALSANITLGAADVSAVPTTRTVNGKALSANVSLTASDVGADPAGSASAVQTSLTAHANNKSNPHGATATQVGICYGTSTNSASATIMSASTTETGFVRNVGSLVGVVFINTRTNSTATTFNFASTGAAPLYDMRTGTAPARGTIHAGITHYFLYNGEAWVLLNPYAPASVYGTCTTGAGTTAKVGTIPDGYSLSNGSMVGLLFTNKNTTSSPTLNVDGTGAKPIYDCRTGTYPVSGAMGANMVHYFQNSGDAWILLNPYIDVPDISAIPPGSYYGTSTTAIATVAKTVSISGFTKTAGAIVRIKFTNGNTATNPTINITATGASPMLFRGAGFSYGVINPNDTVTIMWDGANYIILDVTQEVIKNKQNYLYNWDFRYRTVNQREEAIHTAGLKYTIDCWKNNTSGFTTEIVPRDSATGEDGYIKFVETANAIQKVQQFVENPGRLSGADVTCTIIYKAAENGTLYISGNGSVSSASEIIPATGEEWGVFKFTRTMQEDLTEMYVQINLSRTSAARKEFYLKAIKLEEGKTSTLLFDPPADYDEELRKCQRFYWRMYAKASRSLCLSMATATTDIDWRVTAPVPMASDTIKVTINSGGQLFASPATGNTSTVATIGDLMCADGFGTNPLYIGNLTTSGLTVGNVYNIKPKATTFLEFSCEP